MLCRVFKPMMLSVEGNAELNVDAVEVFKGTLQTMKGNAQADVGALQLSRGHCTLSLWKEMLTLDV
jgi:hypothetical protein